MSAERTFSPQWHTKVVQPRTQFPINVWNTVIFKMKFLQGCWTGNSTTKIKTKTVCFYFIPNVTHTECLLCRNTVKHTNFGHAT